MLYDVAIIGAGVVGAFIARELSRYRLKVCLIEKAADVGTGASGANSGIVHAGYDAEPGSLKAKLNVRGNTMMDRISRELGVPFHKAGSLVLAFSDEDMHKIRELYERGLKNGVSHLEILTSEQVKSMEPAVADDVRGALYAPTAGVTCPFEMVFAAVENAVANGVELKLDCSVTGIAKEMSECEDGMGSRQDVFALSTSKGRIRSRYVVNAAGSYADRISAMIGEDSFSIRPRKGEYLLLDKSQGMIVKRPIFQPPTKMGKGILVIPTVDGNLLIGPNANDIDDKEDRSTTSEGLKQVLEGALKSVPGINLREVITSFAGLRATPSTGDFIIEESGKARGFVNAAGIESPGLTSAPAIALYVVDILKSSGMSAAPNESFIPEREPIRRFIHMSDEERREAIRRDSRYGRVVCRCETVTEAEIVESIRRVAGARTIDAVKKRTRAGMGRCQGGFCTPRIMEILSRELGIPMDEITKFGGRSRLLTGRTK